jgi:hypothetical protein
MMRQRSPLNPRTSSGFKSDRLSVCTDVLVEVEVEVLFVNID